LRSFKYAASFSVAFSDISSMFTPPVPLAIDKLMPKAYSVNCMNPTLSERRPLRALQIEVTSRCTRRCVTCPRRALSDRWREGDLEQPLWKTLEPDLKLAEHVHL